MNIFEALDSDGESTHPSKQQKKKKSKASGKSKPTSQKKSGGERKSGGEQRKPRGGRGGRREGGASGATNSAADQYNSGDSRRDRRAKNTRERGPRKFTRTPRNGTGDKRNSSKKKGAGSHNWGKDGEGSEDVVVMEDEADGADGAVASTEVEEPDNTLTLEEYEAQRQNKRTSAAFQRKVEERQIDTSEYANMQKMTQTCYGEEMENPTGGYGKNLRRKNRNTKENIAADFFKDAPRQRRDVGDKNGRGRGRDKRGRNARSNGGKRHGRVNVNDPNAFPAL
eukprot:g5298.t1